MQESNNRVMSFPSVFFILLLCESFYVKFNFKYDSTYGLYKIIFEIDLHNFNQPVQSIITDLRFLPTERSFWSTVTVKYHFFFIDI